jgi:chromosome segregation ATPase
MQATEARLLAELEGRAAVNFPAELSQRRNDPNVRTAIEGQLSEFDTRRSAIKGQEQVLNKRIAQLQQQISGNLGQVKAYEAQLASSSGRRTVSSTCLRRVW